MRPAFVLLAALILGCGSPSAAPPPPHLVQSVPATDLAAGQDEVSLEVIELMCNPCAAQIYAKSKELPGVTHVSVDLSTKTITLRFDTAVTGRERVVSAVEQIVASIQ